MTTTHVKLPAWLQTVHEAMQKSSDAEQFSARFAECVAGGYVYKSDPSKQFAAARE